MVQDITDVNSFQRQIASSPVTVVMFFATWCGFCQKALPEFDQMEARFSGAVFCKVDIEAASTVATSQSIGPVPTFQIYSGGQSAKTVQGWEQTNLENAINAALTSPTPQQVAPAPAPVGAPQAFGIPGVPQFGISQIPFVPQIPGVPQAQGVQAQGMQIPGVPQIPGLPGLGGGIPGLGGGIPGLGAIPGLGGGIPGLGGIPPPNHQGRRRR